MELSSVSHSQGGFVLSLDFELMWGVYPSQSIETYGTNVLGVREAVPSLLQLFETFGVRATWATVGFLFFDNREELLASLPELKPQFHNKWNTTYSYLDRLGESEKCDPYHFGLSLVRQVADCPGQEIGTHTFSHFFCLEEALDVDAFKADIDASISACLRVGKRPRSIVFPRNQVCKEALEICRDSGIEVFRGPGPFSFDRPRPKRQENRAQRVLRYANSYVPRMQLTAVKTTFEAGMCNVPASRFLRPFSRRFLRGTKFQTNAIRHEMRAAAQNGRLFHLWFHPHNFGLNTQDNLLNLRSILEEFNILRSEFGWASLNMADAANLARATNPVSNRMGGIHA